MSTGNVISIQIPPEDLQAAEDALKLAASKLAPYLIALTPEERRTIPKMSDGSEPFVLKVMDYATADSKFAPPYMDVPEMKKDLDAVLQLKPLLNLATALQSNLDDTTMLAGSEAYVAALSYYNSVKMAAKMNVPGAKTIYEDLFKRFQKQGQRSNKSTE